MTLAQLFKQENFYETLKNMSKKDLKKINKLASNYTGKKYENQILAVLVLSKKFYDESEK
jgi:hypothetical protein